MAPPLHILESVGESKHAHYYVFGIVAVCAFALVRYLYQTLTSPLRNVPGPFLARFTRLWELQAIRKHDNAALNIALHDKYGKSTLHLLLPTFPCSAVQCKQIHSCRQALSCASLQIATASTMEKLPR